MAFWQLNAPALADLSGNLPIDRVTGDLPYERLGGKTLARVAVTTDIDIPFASTEISDFRKNVHVPTAGLVYLTWSIDMSHRGISAGSPTYDPPAASGGSGGMPAGAYYPIGISGKVTYRRATTVPGLTGGFTDLDITLGAGQLSDRKQHYQTIGQARVPFAVDAGYYYQFSLSLSSHTDAGSMNGVDGAAELTTGGGKNFLLIEYEPGTISIG